MNTNQLNCVINCDPALSTYVLGTFPSDRLPMYVKRRPCGVIANTDPYYKQGQHWVGLFITERNTGEFFCSLGQSIEHYTRSFTDFFLRNGVRSITSNAIRLQSELSSVCGFYVVYFLTHRCRGVPMSDIISEFDPRNTNINDAYVSDFVENIFPLCI